MTLRRPDQMSKSSHKSHMTLEYAQVVAKCGDNPENVRATNIHTHTNTHTHVSANESRNGSHKNPHIHRIKLQLWLQNRFVCSFYLCMTLPLPSLQFHISLSVSFSRSSHQNDGPAADGVYNSHWRKILWKICPKIKTFAILIHEHGCT